MAHNVEQTRQQYTYYANRTHQPYCRLEKWKNKILRKYNYLLDYFYQSEEFSGYGSNKLSQRRRKKLTEIINTLLKIDLVNSNTIPEWFFLEGQI